MTEIKDNLAKYRRQLGINQTALADKIGIGQQIYARWERGQSEPKISWLIKLSKEFGVLVDDLVGADSWLTYPENEPKTEGKYTVFIDNGKSEFQIDVNYINGEFQVAHKDSITHFRPIAQNPIK